MLKLRSISKIDFDNYIQENKKTSHFMQTSAWGEFEKITNHTTPNYLGLIKDNDKIVAATLLIEEHLPMNHSTLYAPRGFIIDYNNKKLLKLFITKLKAFAKYKKAISIKINPAICYKTYNSKNKETINKTSEEIILTLRELGFKKHSNIKLLEYTYQIDLTKDLQEIKANYSKNVNEKISLTEKYDIELIIGSQKNLVELFNLQENPNIDYYETLYDIFSNNDYTKLKLFLGKLHITKTIKILEKELRRINNQIAIIPIDNLDSSSKQKLTNLRNQKNAINKDIEKFKKFKLEYGNYLTISASLMMEHNNEVWILNEASNHIIDETNLRYTIYNEYIKHYKEQGFYFLNQLSPIDYNPSFNEFKKEFGSEFIEFIGEYDLITNKFMYIIQEKILPIFNNKKKEVQNETSNSNKKRI